MSFLDAYDFASEAAEDVRDDQKSLISPSVLGLIFEKINGYKDGSYFTPGFVTMAMARATIRRAVVNRFNESKGWTCESFESLYDKISDRAEANRIVNSVRICDPAVGSGHFLVSALNELLAVKSDLRILQDGEGRRLKEYDLAVSNDELVVRDEDGKLVSYRPSNPESHRVQEALFREKRTIIEACLFGVDVNPNSVKICQLRLWIELLKHAFYKPDGELETLPNIDINIKVGNSLISRFPLDADLRPALKKTKRTLTSYREAVSNYQNATSREAKAEVEELIRQIKGDFRVEILSNDPKVRRRASLTEEIRSLRGQQSFGETQVTKAARKARLAKLEGDLAKLSAQIKAIEENRIFQAAFEWRFEFPEVLNENGDFEGFDAVIGNPPYISALALSKSAEPAELRHYKAAYATSKGTVDLYVYFFELGVKLLRPGAYLSYISPNRYLSASYGTALRGFLLDETSLEVIGDYSNVKVFAEAATYPIVTMLSKRRNAHNLRAFTFVAPDQPLRWRQIAAGDLRAVNDNILGFVLSDKFEVTKKLMLDSDSLGTCGAINATSTAGEAEKYHAFINQSGGFKLVNSGTIDKFCTSWGRKPLRDKRTEFLTPYLADEEEALGANRVSLYSSPKIIFAKIGITPEAFYDEGGVYASINTNCIHSFTPEYDPFYVLAWVNSKLFQYMYECFFDGLKMSGGYLLYSAPNLSNMYIRRASDEDQRAIGALARSIAARLSTEPSGDVQALHGELDRRFYEVFALSADEVAMVEEGVRRSGGTSDAEADTMDAVTAGDLEEET